MSAGDSRGRKTGRWTDSRGLYWYESYLLLIGRMGGTDIERGEEQKSEDEVCVN